MKALIYVDRYLEILELIERYVRITTAYLEEQGHYVSVCSDLECGVREVEDADIVLCWAFPEELLSAAKRLKWIQFGSAGIDHTLFPKLVESEIILTTLSGVHQVPVAEHTMALILSLRRGIHTAMEQQLRAEWQRAPISEPVGELSGMTIGIVGLGKIGLEIARLAKCFNMRVIGTKKTVTGDIPNVDEALPPSGLHKALRNADVLVLVSPLTEATRALIGEKELDMMKPGSYIVNVARGQMIDHDALIEKLKSGHISGAGLDVFPQEPLPPGDPLWRAPNIIITPHTAGSTPHYPERAAEIFKKNLDAFISGEPMVNVYDRQRGY